jgi:hypothetical protein
MLYQLQYSDATDFHFILYMSNQTEEDEWFFKNSNRETQNNQNIFPLKYKWCTDDHILFRLT